MTLTPPPAKLLNSADPGAQFSWPWPRSRCSITMTLDNPWRRSILVAGRIPARDTAW